MRNITSGFAVLAATTAVIATSAGVASADDSASTEVTFELQGGALSISAAPSALLNPGSSGDTTVSGALGEVVVTDARGGTAGWAVSASSTGAVTDGVTVAESVSYDAGVVTETGTVSVLSTGDVLLDALGVGVVTGSDVVGNNTATWNPTLTVTLPVSSTAGLNSGTIVTSVL